jgi:D-glycero-alpha-D-manno-heptose-7-phosphate kinase
MIITKAPLRVSFFGGGTDFPEYFLKESGAVLAAAIPYYTYVTASRFPSGLFDYRVRISYSKGEMVNEINELQHPVFRECLRLCGIEHDIELHTVADLPSFTGLGASSSFTVALLQALHAYKGEYRRPLELAYEAIYVERSLLREAVGVQDQTTAAVGGFNVLEFRAEDDIQVTPLQLTRARLEELEAHLFMVFTGIKRRAAEVESGKLVRLNEVKPNLRRMRQMVDSGYDLLTSGGSLDRFGLLLHEAWVAKQTLSPGVSNEEIRRMYDLGLEAGAWGGKLLGAGGGGFLLFCAPPEARLALAERFRDQYQVEIRLGVPGTTVLFAQ